MNRAAASAVAALLLGGAIAALSLAPVERIPRVGPSILEHAIAYAGALAIVLALCPPGRARLAVALAATVAAGAMEVVQPFFGRGAALSDFIGSAAGIWLAFGLVAGLRRLR